MPILHESYLSPDDYPTRLEHLLAPSHEHLAGTTEQVQQLARELPLAEAADLLGPAYPEYLIDLFELHYRPRPAQALPYAEALVAHDPHRAEYREARLWCRAHAALPDYAALLADYAWLAAQPLPGYDHWLRTLQQANPNCSPDDLAYLAHYEHGRDLVLHLGYCLGGAWASYRLGDLVAANKYFNQGFTTPPAAIDHGYDHSSWRVGLWPPVPDSGFLLWLLSQPLPWCAQARHWASLATAQL